MLALYSSYNCKVHLYSLEPTRISAGITGQSTRTLLEVKVPSGTF